LLAVALLIVGVSDAAEKSSQRTYSNTLRALVDAKPLLADYPEFVQPVIERRRFEAPRLVDDADADLSVRAWRFSYNARGIIEIPNRLKASKTAIVVVHPWGIDDGQGWKTPEPAGAAFGCTPEKNQLMLKHGKTVINPFLKSLRRKGWVDRLQSPRQRRFDLREALPLDSQKTVRFRAKTRAERTNLEATVVQFSR
jgi:hypothetical protein